MSSSRLAKSKISGLKNLFFKHVRKFLFQVDLLPPSGRALAAVSGGADSVVLLLCLHEFLQQGLLKSLTVLHVNHNTRPESDFEAQWVQQLAQRLQLDLILKKLPPGLGQAPNFEHRARQERYGFFDQLTEVGDRIYTGHHLNDSFEWSLLQQLRSSSTLPTLGIPVKNGQMARPFMCVSKEQILYFATATGVTFCEDQSNRDSRYERNFLRNEIIPSLKKRYPNYLKHYVDRSNFLAKEWKVSALMLNDPMVSVGGVTSSPRTDLSFTDPAGVYVFFKTSTGGAWGPIEEKVRHAIHNLSCKKRGMVRTQIGKMLEASLKGKWGPMRFSGGVEGHMFPGMVGLLNEVCRRRLSELDHKWSAQLLEEGEGFFHGDMKAKACFLENFNSNFPSRLLAGNDFFPFWVISPELSRMNSILPSCRRVHPLWPETTRLFIERGIWFRAGGELWHFLAKKGKKRDILPLCKEAFIIYF